MNAIAFPSLDLQPTVEVVDLEKLYLSPLNPRQEVDLEQISLLAKSLVACGQVQNLVGLLDEDGRIGITAGGRRLRALNIAVLERPDLAAVKVLIAPDQDTAVQWSIAENVARKDMEPVQEIAAYDEMRKRGSAVTEIASAFGNTEAHVYRRLKLAALPQNVLDALAERKINLSQAEAFTLSQDIERSTSTLEHVIRNKNNAEWIRNQLKSGTVLHTDRRAAFVGLEAYKNAGGAVETDLFGTSVYLEDAALLNTLFEERLQVEAAKVIADGWAWADTFSESYFRCYESNFTRIHGKIMPQSDEDSERMREFDRRLNNDEELTDEEEAEFAALEARASKMWFTDDQKAVAGMMVGVGYNGDIVVEGPYIRPEEAQQALETGVVASLNQNTLKQDKPKAMFSQAVKDDLKAIQLHALQSKLRQNPKMALSLLAFSLSDASGSKSMFGWQVTKPKNEPSAPEGFAPDEALLFNKADMNSSGGIKAAFNEFCQKPEDEILELLVSSAVRTIHYDFGMGYSGDEKAFFGSLVKSLSAGEREVWTPTKAGFWGRMPAAYIDGKFLELTGLPEDGTEYEAFTKQKKSDKAQDMERLFNDADYQKGLKLTKAQVKALSAWMPDPEE